MFLRGVQLGPRVLHRLILGSRAHNGFHNCAMSAIDKASEDFMTATKRARASATAMTGELPTDIEVC